MKTHIFVSAKGWDVYSYMSITDCDNDFSWNIRCQLVFMGDRRALYRARIILPHANRKKQS